MNFDSGFPQFDTSPADHGDSYLRSSAARPARVALIGTFPPRKCGIATFTCDIVEQAALHTPEIAFDVYALDEGKKAAPPYRAGVTTLPADDPAAYRSAAEAINASGADAVWLQHEYGIFGGTDGEMVCDFADRIAAPLILTLHTVLSDPSESSAAFSTIAARAAGDGDEPHSRLLIELWCDLPPSSSNRARRPIVRGTDRDGQGRAGLAGRLVRTFGLRVWQGVEQVSTLCPHP